MKTNTLKTLTSICTLIFVLLWNSAASGTEIFPNTEANSSDSLNKSSTYVPHQGFKILRAEKGEINFKIFSYIRYLNQLSTDSTFTDSFGNVSPVRRRQDTQVNKVNIQFLGWFLDPNFRYLFYVWSNNTAQGLGAQVVVAGALRYRFNKHLVLGGGINSLPGTRTTEGTFPFWFSVDNRTIADEFFRPSYTTGFWAEGKIMDKLSYIVMIGNNLSQLGVDAGQLDNKFNTLSGELVWFPTTGEFGSRSGYGDYENHQKIATRLGVHYTTSDEDRQGQPNSDAFENVTMRLSDGNVVFKPYLFGSGISIYNITYNMGSVDAGIKYKGFSLEGEYYNRRLNNISGPGTDSLTFDDLNDHGFQLMASSMLIKKKLQLYVSTSKVLGEYGNPSDFRTGLTFYPWEESSTLLNFEYINLDRSPVGGLSLPYEVGGNGSVFYFNLMVDF